MRTSLRLRLMVLMICLTTLPVVTVTWIATNNTRSSVEKEIINANNSRMLWADQYLEELHQQIDILFYSLQINQTLMAGLNDMNNPDIGVQFNTQNYIKNTLTSAFYANSRKIDELNLYIHPIQKAFSVSYANSGTIYSLNIQEGNWGRMLQTPINMYFKQSGSAIYAYHSMNRFEDRMLLGGISVRINKQVWREVSDILKSESESSVYLINDQGELLSGSTETMDALELQSQLQSLDQNDFELAFRRTKTDFYFLKRVGDGQLTVVKVIPLRTVNQSAQPTIQAGILTGTLFAIASILLSIFVSLRISRPIVKLAKTMKMTHIHNFKMSPVQSRDEIGLLENGYNSMMKRIKELIEVEYQQEIDLKNAQLMALQAQINPHFLNNTLNLMGGMALVKDAPEIYEITRVMGELLRYSISADGDLVPLEDEIKHMRNYLYIQEQRFVDRCCMHVSTDERALTARLPKFTLQPILENAFEHGLQRKEGKWNIEIRIRLIGKRVYIFIKDDGVGVDGQRLYELRTDLRDGQLAPRARNNDVRKKRGIGLRNVHARLKLQFGKGCGVRIFSKTGVGTLVVLVLAAVTQEEGDKTDAERIDHR
ncbi:two-component system sensor histidine kinase YesM [Paenibacillus sp. V4I3]|uniref:sensor histidine kinase n=1 Tax=unclassified Paenibacillus TaxID=185978 RepID=UPI00277F1649|nr:MULTISPECIES: sensor histidine kinase [unclassified Paenibacillus]MDQ0878655.1 two-component system sensor histidine kinase YesM [Paenibacillus sp. V4I3]MDQ0885488.1 two-component system sensor histidine kinase YesM [Paenibacillus sp. V4I9]